MPPDILEFEEPIGVLLKESEALTLLPHTDARDRELESLRRRIESVRTQLYASLTPWQRVLVARHPSRPGLEDFVTRLFPDFVEIHGDRRFADDHAIMAGFATYKDQPVLLVGHVTKEGALAGPRVLEHLVDCVLQFEGERERTYRTVRAIKNRFGSTNEAGVFEMRDQGLVEVLDASARFLSQATRSPGSVVLCAMEGSRPLLVEVQALVSSSELVPPRRVVAGLDRNRLALVLAVLGRHAGIGLGNADVFVNVVGGVRVDEPGADLAVALAVASAAKRVALTGDGDRPLACFGELGLTGELRSVAHADRRMSEAERFGLTPVVAPEVHKTLREALAAALGPARRVAQAA